MEPDVPPYILPFPASPTSFYRRHMHAHGVSDPDRIQIETETHVDAWKGGGDQWELGMRNRGVEFQGS